MAVQHAIQVDLVSAAQATLGTVVAPNAAGAKRLRKVSSSLTLTKDSFSSNEVRADQQISDMRHGMERGAGSIEGELSNSTYDQYIEALMRGTWTDGVTAAASDFTQLAAARVDARSGTFTWTAGDPIAKGFRIGDIIGTTGSTGNDAGQFRITGFSGASNRVIAVTPGPAAHAALAATAFVVIGDKVLNGIQKKLFTIEQPLVDAGHTELYIDSRINTGQFRIPPNGMATASFDVMSRGFDLKVLADGDTVPYFTNPTPAGTDDILAGPGGSLRLAGIERGTVTGFDLSIALGMSSDPVVGSKQGVDIFYGPTVITGNVSYYVEDAALLKAFRNETIVDIVAVATAAGLGRPAFLSFNMQRVKLSGYSKTVAAQGGVIATSAFQALLGAGGAGTDATTMTVQRSNPI